MSSSSLVVVGYLYVVASAPIHEKHTRYCRLTRMDHWPSLSPRSFSSLLPGGARRSSTFVAALSTRSFDNALSQFSRNRLRFAAPKEPLGFLVGEALYHIRILARLINSVKH